MLRLLAGWFEIANVDERLSEFGGQRGESPFRLGSLATAWPRLATASDARQLRDALAASPWGDPGSVDPAEIALGMRLSWGARVAARIPAARPWVGGGVETRRRRHAIADRRIPQLEETLHALIQHLEEDERADTVRLRWAARQPEVRP
jgi:hypothetical protein